MSPWLAWSGGDQGVACHVDVTRRVDGHTPCRTRSELTRPRLSRLRIGRRHCGGLGPDEALDDCVSSAHLGQLMGN